MFRTGLLLLAALAITGREACAQGNPLGPEFVINSYTTANQYHPALALDGSGNFVVVWQSYTQDGWGRGVFGQRYVNNGARLGSEFRVNSYTTEHQTYPAVASDASGNFVVVWTGSLVDGSSDGIFGQRYTASGAPLGPEFGVNTHTTAQQMYPSVAADPSGNFVVVWRSDFQDGSLSGVFGQRYDASGAPLGPEFRVNTYTTANQYLPAVALDASGNFVVVWSSDTQDGSGLGVFGQRYSASGAAVGPEFRVNTYTTYAQSHPAVASDSVGNFVVIWHSFQDGAYADISGQRYASSGTPLGGEFRVNTSTIVSQFHPSVASDSAGNFVVVWQTNYTSLSSNVFGQRYDASGTPLGLEFRVNTYTTFGQSHQAVASNTSGNFVVIWQSAYQDGSNYGVFGQRYGMIVPVELMRFGLE